MNGDAATPRQQLRAVLARTRAQIRRLSRELKQLRAIERAIKRIRS